MERKRTFWHYVEDVFILLAVLSLWPRILGWPSPLWRLVEVLMLIVLALIAILRFRRFHHHRTSPPDQ